MAPSFLPFIVLLATLSAALPSFHQKRCDEHLKAANASATAPANTPAVQAKGNGKCPPNFINVVFNVPVNDQPDFNGRFQKIRDVAGADRWIGFQVTPPGNADPSSMVTSMQVPLLMNPDEGYMADAMQYVGKMPYTITFNEPDLAPTNAANRVFLPQEAAAQAKKHILSMPNVPGMNLIGPGPAFPGDFNKQFFDACGCLDQYHAVALHLYDWHIDTAQQKIQALADTFPGKPIWITEIAPASFTDQGCNLNQDQVKQWMTEVLTFAMNVESGGKKVVERIFWNFAEAGVFDASNPGNCDSYLTTKGDNGPIEATPILEHLGTICQ